MREKKRKLIEPHGGKLVSLMCKREECSGKKNRNNKTIKLDSLEFSDLIMLGIGAFSPLKGFMNNSDYGSVMKSSRLNNGVLWPIPIILTVSSSKANELSNNDTVLLISPYDDEVVGEINIQEIYPRKIEEESKAVFGYTDLQHPGVFKLFKGNKKYCIGGIVKVFSEGKYPQEFPQYARPDRVREIFLERGWNNIVAFQTRNPIHRSHEYLTKIVLEISDGLFIHPIVGELKEGDIPADIRMECYEVLIKNYYPENKVLLKVYPMEMRYAGPKEAILHAIIRQNFGCNRIIIGRDHAGVGNYYGSYDAQDIFDQYTDKDLKIKPIKMDWTFWCSKCNQMASKRTCPHSDKDHILISGTKLRGMLSNGTMPPGFISRPEISEILMKYYQKVYS